VNGSEALVTGGSGFVGGYLIRALRAQGHVARGLARSAEAARAVEDAGAEPVRGDLDDPAGLRDAMRGADLVFHAAAKVDEWGRPAEFERVNVEGTKNVLWAARRAGVGRVVHVSTEAVLRDGRPLVEVDERAPLARRPVGWYARSKRDAERAALAANGDGLETVVVRPVFVWGPGDTGWLPGLREAVRTGRFRWIDGGRRPISTTHVANAAHGLVLASERGRAGEVYFVTDGPAIEIREMVTRYLATVGIRPPDRNVQLAGARFMAATAESLWRAFGVRKPPPATRTAVDILGLQCTVVDAKARSELGYEPVVDRDRALEELSTTRGR
jgi:nucleoside-diphosphate-sugar epimerase